MTIDQREPVERGNLVEPLGRGSLLEPKVGGAKAEQTGLLRRSEGSEAGQQGINGDGAGLENRLSFVAMVAIQILIG